MRSVLDADVPFKINARTQRDRVAQWISLKTANPQMTNPEIAKTLGLSPNTLSSIISRARREGWLTFNNPLDVIEHDIIPKTLANINARLDLNDKDVTIEAMKGFIVPQWKEARGLNENKVTVLALKIEMPEGDPSAVQRGTISATPRLTLPPLEAEYEEASDT
ncbi:MAG: winged helix-turn-helix domain-containing protein [Actinobacteria bacterium]|nr:winged helix-turn-helix domain-containing protein [Actinomycetota bacterium]